MSSSETRFHGSDSDTHVQMLPPGQAVRVAAGPLMGLTGTVVERRGGGRILVRIQTGVFVVILHFLLEPVQPSKSSSDSKRRDR